MNIDVSRQLRANVTYVRMTCMYSCHCDTAGTMIRGCDSAVMGTSQTCMYSCHCDIAGRMIRGCDSAVMGTSQTCMYSCHCDTAGTMIRGCDSAVTGTSQTCMYSCRCACFNFSSVIRCSVSMPSYSSEFISLLQRRTLYATSLHRNNYIFQ